MQYDVIAVKLNETYMKLICSDDGIEHDLYDYFTFEAEGIQYSKRVYSGGWDGVSHLFSLHTKQLFCGLIDIVYSFCNERNISIRIDPRLMECNEVDKKELESFIDTEFDIHTDCNKITPYEYQMTSIHHAIKFNRSTLLAATSAGKSLILYSLARYYQLIEEMENKRILIIVPNIGLCNQLYADFKDYSNNTLKDWHVEDNLQIINMDYRCKSFNSSIVISTWQSIYKLPPEAYESIGAVLVDEVHLAKSDSFKAIFKNLTHTKFRHGMTGTLDEIPVNKLVIAGQLGKVKRIVKTHELQRDGRASKLNITMVTLKYPNNECKIVHKLDYIPEKNYIMDHVKRNRFIQNVVRSLKGNTLVLFDRNEKLGLPLYEDMKETRDNTFLVVGSVKGKQREYIRNMCEKLDDAIIYANFACMSTGVSIKNLHNLVIISSSKSKVRMLQSIGRLLRLHESKTIANVIDLNDDFSYKGKSNISLRHARARWKMYKDEKWDVDFISHQFD